MLIVLLPQRIRTCVVYGDLWHLWYGLTSGVCFGAKQVVSAGSVIDCILALSRKLVVIQVSVWLSLCFYHYTDFGNVLLLLTRQRRGWFYLYILQYKLLL
jgi:hypothetical protein